MNAAAARLNMSRGPAQDGGGRAPARHPLRAARGRVARARHVGGDAAGADRRLRRASPTAAGAVEPHLIKRVRTGSGRVLYQRPEETAHGWWRPQHVGALNDMLNAVLVSGTGRRAALPVHPAAGKTGTSQEFRDAWFVGYTAHFVGGVWVGNDDGRPMNNVMGGSLPARLWHEVMVLAHEGKTPKALPGTMPAAPLAAPAANQTKAMLNREQPALQTERIDEDFVRRAVQRSGGADVPHPPARAPKGGAASDGGATNKLRRWASVGTREHGAARVHCRGSNASGLEQARSTTSFSGRSHRSGADRCRGCAASAWPPRCAACSA